MTSFILQSQTYSVAQFPEDLDQHVMVNFNTESNRVLYIQYYQQNIDAKCSCSCSSFTTWSFHTESGRLESFFILEQYFFFFLYVCRLLCVAAKLHFCKDIKLWPLTDLWIWSRFYSLLATTVAVWCVRTHGTTWQTLTFTKQFCTQLNMMCIWAKYILLQ